MTNATSTNDSRPTLVLDGEKFAKVSRFAAGKDEPRLALQYVRVEPCPSGTGVIMVATNGAAMLVARDEAGNADRPYLLKLDGKSLTKLKRASAKNKAWLVCKNPLAGDADMVHEWVMAAEIWGDGVAVTDPSIVTGSFSSCTFPDWRRVVPKKSGKPAVSAYQPWILSLFEGVSAFVTIHSNADDGPSLVDLNNPDMVAVIIGAARGHMARSFTTPDWCFASKEEPGEPDALRIAA